MKHATIALLSILIAVSYTYAIHTFEANRAELLVTLSEFIERVTFPLKLAELHGEPPSSSLPLPVHGVRLNDVADTWGAARSNGRRHEGTDIFAAHGTPVYAATHGYVIRTGVNALGGNFVMTVGPGGIRYYYAHLSRVASGIAFGTKVTTDTVLGFVGDTGNAAGTPPHLHFGVYGKGATNPYPFLTERS